MWLVPGDVGGSEEYTVGLLEALADAAPRDLDVTLFVNGSFSSAHPDLAGAWRTVVAPVSGRSRPRRVLAESTWLAAESRRRRLDVVHHAGGTIPWVSPVPSVVTLHDLQPLAHPERFSALKRTYIRAVAPPSLRRARIVITLTTFTGRDAVDRCGVDPRHLRLVPSGVDRPGPLPRSVDPDAVLGRLGLAGRRVVLYPAITYAHKNHETLVRALSLLVGARPDLALVLTGRAGPAESHLDAAVAAYGLEQHVVRTGRIPATDLEVLYRRASVLAFPSAYEGFGLPVVEAMSRGCPVVASDAGALPDVTGGAAVIVDPYDATAWATALADVLDHPARAEALVAAGRRRALAFAWPRSAAALADAYHDAARPDLGSHPIDPAHQEPR
nr:glycosyltransferase family 1 protein [Rhabdothermincola salaria]